MQHQQLSLRNIDFFPLLNPAGFTQATPPVLLSPTHGLYVRAHLPPPTPYLWHSVIVM